MLCFGFATGCTSGWELEGLVRPRVDGVTAMGLNTPGLC